MSETHLIQCINMASSPLQDVISGLYKAVMDQQKVVQDQEDHIQFLNETNSLIDVEEATGVHKQQENKQLRTFRATQVELESNLEQAVSEWQALGHDGQPWAKSMPSPNPTSEQPGPPLSLSPYAYQSRATAPNLQAYLTDPEVGVKARYAAAQQHWLAGPHVDPSQLTLERKVTRQTPAEPETPNTLRWWTSDNPEAPVRPYGKPGYVAPTQRSFGREVTASAQHRGFRYQLLPTDFADEEFDPAFWGKHLEHSGDIFADRFTVLQSEGCKRESVDGGVPLSPRTLSQTSPRQPPGPSFSAALRRYNSTTKGSIQS